jgi:hypothetical protein
LRALSSQFEASSIRFLFAAGRERHPPADPVWYYRRAIQLNEQHSARSSGRVRACSRQ